MDQLAKAQREAEIERKRKECRIIGNYLDVKYKNINLNLLEEIYKKHLKNKKEIYL